MRGVVAACAPHLPSARQGSGSFSKAARVGGSLIVILRGVQYSPYSMDDGIQPHRDERT